MRSRLPPDVTEIHSPDELWAYRSVNPSEWALGIRDFWRITPIGVFPQVPGGRTKCYAVPEGKPRSLDALVQVLLNSPDAKNTLGYRLYGHREIQAEVIAAVERAGYTVHGMPLAAGNKPNIPAADLRELRARGLEVVYALKRPRCKFYCYFGTSKDGERRGYEHWRFGSVEMVILKKLPAPEVRAAETACIAEYDRLKRPLYNVQGRRLLDCRWPEEPLIGSLLPA